MIFKAIQKPRQLSGFAYFDPNKINGQNLKRSIPQNQSGAYKVLFRKDAEEVGGLTAAHTTSTI